MSGPDPGPAPTQGPDSVQSVAWTAPQRRRRRWAWPVALLGTLGLAVGLRLVQQLGQMSPPAAGSAEASASDAAAASSGASGSATAHTGLSESSPQLAHASQTAARVARATTAALAAVTHRGESSMPTERTLDLCGLGRLSLSLTPPADRGRGSDNAASGAAASSASLAPVPGLPGWAAPAGLPVALGEQARADVWPELLRALQAPGQPPRAQAAALLLRAMGVAQSGADAAPTPRRAPGRALAELARRARPVVRVAGQPPQGDATVLRWALALCSAQPKPTAECRRIGPRDLVRLAPEDSASWLSLAADMRLPQAERLDAMRRAASAPQFTALGSALAATLDAVWPAHRPGHLRAQVLAQAQALERSLPQTEMPMVLQTCSTQALAAPVTPDSVHAPCDALARQMQARGPDLDWLSAAVLLARRLDWPEAERHAWGREEAALAALQAPPEAVREQPLSCPALAWTRGRVQATAQLGELAWLRQRHAALGGEPVPAAPPPAEPGLASAASSPAASAGR